jgi:hypothetical protein
VTADETEILNDILGDLKELAKVVGRVPEPERAVLSAQLFITVQKVRYLLGDRDAVRKPEGEP